MTGDARVTGILTIGTGSIVLDPTAKQLRGLEEIVIGIANTITIKQDVKVKLNLQMQLELLSLLELELLYLSIHLVLSLRQVLWVALRVT